jgi:hypothetical protein
MGAAATTGTWGVAATYGTITRCCWMMNCGCGARIWGCAATTRGWGCSTGAFLSLSWSLPRWWNGRWRSLRSARTGQPAGAVQDQQQSEWTHNMQVMMFVSNAHTWLSASRLTSQPAASQPASQKSSKHGFLLHLQSQVSLTHHYNLMQFDCTIIHIVNLGCHIHANTLLFCCCCW